MKVLRPYQQDAVKECWDALKKDDAPVLLMASVGAGKSLMLASILITMQKAGKRALCLVNNAELVRNNCATFIEQGGDASIYCAALGEKDDHSTVIFGTPQSVLNAINKNEPLSHIHFNIIVVDEAHNINFHNDRTCFMRILRHYKHQYPDMRLLGATGTNFRYKGSEIVGDNCLFKTQVGNITTEQLIKDGYLIDPNFEIEKELMLDFSNVRIQSNGKFNAKELEEVVTQSARLTELICKQIIHVMVSQKRFGCFIFATNKKHAEDIMSHLPPSESALILGETPQDERTRILNDARAGKIKYLVNIAIISVGIDVPPFDTLAYLRPTESLVLFVQTMGRVLRLSDKTGKKDALVLDFAGNIERHQDWDNPILLKAVRQALNEEKALVIKCPKCFQLNSEHARRCIGERRYEDRETGKEIIVRCDYFFEFKECPNDDCKAQNDIASRHCRLCQTEIIDPNDRLSIEPAKEGLHELNVLRAYFKVHPTQSAFRVSAAYICKNEEGKQSTYYENFTPTSEKAKHVFYGQFVKKHCTNASDWYPHLTDAGKMVMMLGFAKEPTKIWIKHESNGYRIKKKEFNVEGAGFEHYQGSTGASQRSTT